MTKGRLAEKLNLLNVDTRKIHMRICINMQQPRGPGGRFLTGMEMEERKTISPGKANEVEAKTSLSECQVESLSAML